MTVTKPVRSDGGKLARTNGYVQTVKKEFSSTCKSAGNGEFFKAWNPREASYLDALHFQASNACLSFSEINLDLPTPPSARSHLGHYS